MNIATARSWAPATTELGTVPTEHLEAQLCEWASLLAAADSRFIEMIAEFDRRKGWASWGMASCAHWLSWKCALSPSAARERVRVANAIGALPVMQQAFRDGILSYSKVRALTRVATPETETDLLELARHATASQVETIVRAWRRCLESSELDKARLQHAKRSMSWYRDDDGCLVGTFRLPPDDGDIVVNAIQESLASRHATAGEGASAETPSLAQQRADALVALADTHLGGGTQRSGDKRVMTVIEVDADALAGTQPGRCELRGGPAVSAETARRLACDAIETYVLVDGNGDAVGETRPTQTIPRRIRRALEHRDKGRCVFPGCSNHQWVEAHHVVHRARGGSHDLENLATLCKHHHHAVHEGGFRIETINGGRSFTFYRPDGRLVPDDPKMAPADPTRLAAHLEALGLRPRPSSLASGSGERLNLELAIWILAMNAKLRQPVSAETTKAVGQGL